MVIKKWVSLFKFVHDSSFCTANETLKLYICTQEKFKFKIMYKIS